MKVSSTDLLLNKKFNDCMHIPLIFISYPTLLIVCLISDRLEGDEDEPDLPLLSTLDFAALKDVRQTGMEYCRSYERTLHETPGLQPGYLPEKDSLYLLSGVSISNNFK